MSVEAKSNAAIEAVKDSAEKAVEDVKPWFIWFSRFGFAAKGVVYIVTGILLSLAATGQHSAKINRKDVLVSILIQPFGKYMLGIVGFGLAGYALFRLVEAILDPEHKGRDAKGLVKRVGYASSGLAYGGLALLAVRLMMGLPQKGSQSPTTKLAALAFTSSFGRWVVGLAGLVVIAIGMYQFYLAYKAFFQRKLKSGEMNQTEKVWARRTARAGITARGSIYIVIGLFLVQAARTHNPSKVGNLGDAFQAVAEAPFGPWLLGALAIGMVAYGIFAFFESRYRRIDL